MTKTPIGEMTETTRKQKENIPVETIVKEYGPRVKSFIRKWTSNEEDVEDILQDLFYQMIRNANRIEHTLTWMFRVARNMVINKNKKKHEEELPHPLYGDDGFAEEEWTKTLFEEDNPTPETMYLRTLVKQEVDAALSELPPEQQEVFELTVYDGIPVKEIAKATGISVATLLSRKHYAVKHLRNRLNNLYEEFMNY